MKSSALRFSGFEKPALLAAAFRRLFRGGSCASSGVAAAEGDLFTGNKGATGTEAGDEGREVSRADMIRFQSVVLRRRWRLIHTQTDLQKLSIVNVNLRAAQNALCRNNNDWPLLPSFIVLSVLAGGLKSVWNAHRAIPCYFYISYTIQFLYSQYAYGVPPIYPAFSSEPFPYLVTMSQTSKYQRNTHSHSSSK